MNFGGLSERDSVFESSQFVVISLPYDETASYQKGTVDGPKAIIEASAQVELFDEELESETYKLGIHTYPAFDISGKPEAMIEKTLNVYRKLMKTDKVLVGLGGEHSVSYGPIKAYHEKFPNLSVLQFDAHADLRDGYEGEKFSHAAVMRRVCELCPVTQIGIRNYSKEEYPLIFGKNNISTFLWHKTQPLEKYHDVILNTLSDVVYVTIDTDGFDPAILPATGTPEPGGLSWKDATGLLKEVALHKKIVGFDIVELMPLENNKVSDFTCAKLAYRLMGYSALSLGAL
ncbi:MAG: agmatinase [Deltaproteobacteria bacterium]|nr:agmatinase [Deltaproteobacteria bacterium]